VRTPVLAALLLAAAGAAAAQGIDLSQGGPVEVTAADGIEWRQQEQVVIARGEVRAVRGAVTVAADRLIARYRPRGGTTMAAAPGESPGSGEIWRLEAEGHVVIATATDRAEGDRAVYDMDQAVMVMTGRNLRLVNAEHTLTARDSLEYWSARRMAVARGNAVVVTRDGRRVRADTLVAYFADTPAASTARPRQPAAAEGPALSRIERIEAFGNVEIRTEQDVVRGDRGVYDPNAGLARLLGEVRITRGENTLAGQEAILNMRTGVARLISAPGARVQGLVVPQQGAAERREAPR